jgi:hypothetical protein
MSGSNYFSYFPKVQYTSPIDGSENTVVNIFKRIKVRDLSTVVKSSIYYKYTIKDGERPEDIAQSYYGDTQYYWIILYANDIINVYAQWPKNHIEFENYIVSKYGSVDVAANEKNIHHKEDHFGNWLVTPTYTYYDTENDREVIALSRIVTVYDYENELNEKKRSINIIKNDYLRQIIGEMNNIFEV